MAGANPTLRGASGRPAEIFYGYIMESYHLRLTVDRARAITFMPLLVSKFKVSACVCAFEKPEDNPDNEHIHAHLEIENYKKSTMSDFMKKHGFSGKYYCKLLQKTKHDNLVYVLKNGDIIYSLGINQEDIDNALNDTERINDEKKKPMKEQLLDEWNKRYQQETYLKGKYVRLPSTKYELLIFIDNYHVERDYLPPTLTLKTQYAIYLLTKINKQKSQTPYYNEEDKAIHFNLYCALNNIRLNDIPESHIPLKMTYDLKEYCPSPSPSDCSDGGLSINYNVEFLE